MVSRTGFGWGLLLMLAAGVNVASMRVHAQSLPPGKNVWPSENPAPSNSPPSSENPDTPAMQDGAVAEQDDADIKDLQIDWSLLDIDVATLMATSPALKPRVAPGATIADMTWSSNDKPNGAAAVSVKQPVSPFWDAKVGADMTVARQPTTMSELLAEKAANGGSEPQSSGTAYAAVTAPGVNVIWDKTAIEARVDPGQEQSKLGTSLSKSLPLGEQNSLSLQNSYNVTQQGVVPLPGIAAHPSRNYETEQSAKLSIGDTGTSFNAGQTLSSTDERWLRKVGAEQKLLGGVSVNGAVSETPAGTLTKSLTAGFKQSW